MFKNDKQFNLYKIPFICILQIKLNAYKNKNLLSTHHNIFNQTTNYK